MQELWNSNQRKPGKIRPKSTNQRLAQRIQVALEDVSHFPDEERRHITTPRLARNVASKPRLRRRSWKNTVLHGECPHDVLDHRGSFKLISRTFCLQCKTFINEVTQSEQRERKQTATGLEAKGSADAVSVVQTLLTQEEKLLSKEEALACVEHRAGYVDGIQRQIKPIELLKALADSIAVLHERVRKKPAVAMVAAYNKAMTALMPVIPGPSRALREVDIMEDGSV